LGLMG